MLHLLFVELADQFTFLNVFRYITFRTGGATMTALLVAFLMGPAFIRWLKKKQKEGQPIREDGPQSHIVAKAGTPTMGGGLILLAGLYTPASFMQHFIVFVLSVFVGFQVIWNVSHSLHTPLMAITNAISSIIILGALMQIGSGSFLILLLAALSVFMAAINIFGGFLVTRRMLAMFQKS